MLSESSVLSASVECCDISDGGGAEANKLRPRIAASTAASNFKCVEGNSNNNNNNNNVLIEAPPFQTLQAEYVKMSGAKF